ncbi:ribonuclease P protein subunit [Candidatus Woesearchaeota archaeon]|nr:ribonuclease P protein subunit [Candidatus Woesearchaeota archaeon]
MASEAMFSRGIIGKRIIIIDATNKSLVSLHGLVVDETRSTFVVETADHQTKRLLKSAITFRLEGEQDVLHGAALKKRPEERLKG